MMPKQKQRPSKLLEFIVKCLNNNKQYPNVCWANKADGVFYYVSVNSNNHSCDPAFSKIYKEWDSISTGNKKIIDAAPDKLKSRFLQAMKASKFLRKLGGKNGTRRKFQIKQEYLSTYCPDAGVLSSFSQSSRCEAVEDAVSDHCYYKGGPNSSSDAELSTSSYSDLSNSPGGIFSPEVDSMDSSESMASELHINKVGLSSNSNEQDGSLDTLGLSEDEWMELYQGLDEFVTDGSDSNFEDFNEWPDGCRDVFCDYFASAEDTGGKNLENRHCLTSTKDPWLLDAGVDTLGHKESWMNNHFYLIKASGLDPDKLGEPPDEDIKRNEYFP